MLSTSHSYKTTSAAHSDTPRKCHICRMPNSPKAAVKASNAEQRKHPRPKSSAARELST